MRTQAIVAGALLIQASCVVSPVEEDVTEATAVEAAVLDETSNERGLRELCLFMGKDAESRESFCRELCPARLKRQCWPAANSGGRAWQNFCNNNFT
ncbi:hypothetical protein [Sorangium sp. So ce131]|uniref:hypothetical protein n=1 Tax=Sorangium sp. So ce131 TaxID=3133282 RepID=UPI003F603BDF